MADKGLLKFALVVAAAAGIVGSELSRRVMPEGSAAAGASTGAPSLDAATPAAAVYAGGSAVTLEADAAGHFHAPCEIEGHTIPMLVDTGATLVALTADDAASIGLNPMPSDYTVKLSTANGIATAAEVRIREMRIGGLVARDVRAVVLPTGLLQHSLLGMSFLQTMAHVEIGSRQLVLRP